MKTIGFAKAVTMKASLKEVPVSVATVLRLPEKNALELLAKQPAACDLTALPICSAWLGVPCVPLRLVR